MTLEQFEDQLACSGFPEGRTYSFQHPIVGTVHVYMFDGFEVVYASGLRNWEISRIGYPKTSSGSTLGEALATADVTVHLETLR